MAINERGSLESQIAAVTEEYQQLIKFPVRIVCHNYACFCSFYRRTDKQRLQETTRSSSTFIIKDETTGCRI